MNIKYTSLMTHYTTNTELILPFLPSNRLHHEHHSSLSAAGSCERLVPVTRLETTSGRISIFSILMRISPGKAMIMMTSAGRGEMCRSSIPAMEPRNTPEPARRKKEYQNHLMWPNGNTLTSVWWIKISLSSHQNFNYRHKLSCESEPRR